MPHLDVEPLPTFRAASEEVLAALRRTYGFGLWMVTRVQADDWIVLAADDEGYGVTDGVVLRWSDSFCSRMVEERGPRVAPDAAAVPAYVEAEIGRRLPIGSYVGVPLVAPDGSLFGTLCGIDPEAKDPSLVAAQPVFEVLGRLLATVLAAELRSQEDVRRAERAEAEAHADLLTGLMNRRGWEKVLAAEDIRARRYGDRAVVVVVDLDGLKARNDRHGHHAGDALIRRAADVLRSTARSSDCVARLGGDEFGILAPAQDMAGCTALVSRVRRALAEADVAASVGAALRDSGGSMLDAWRAADAAMYEDKRAHAD